METDFMETVENMEKSKEMIFDSDKFVPTRTRWTAILFRTIAFGLSIYYLIHLLPTFFLPLGWFFLGLVFMGLNAVGYSCKWGSFSRFEIVNYLIGNLVTTPLLFPYEAWKSWSEISLGISWIPSITAWWNSNINLLRIFSSGNLMLIASVSYFYVAAAISLTGVVYLFGFWGLCNYWLFPWIVYHFWMSAVISMSYQSSKSDDSGATIVIHCKYPRWFEFLTNDISYMITSQYLSTLIPNYNIKEAYNTLRLSANRSKWIQGLSFIFQEESLGATIQRRLKSKKLTINWPTLLFLAILHVLSVYGIMTTTLNRNTAIVGAMEGSILWWARDHRAHHRFSDTDKDPYGVNNGLAWAHLGWMLVKKDKKTIGKTDISDLTSDRLVVWQDKNFRWFALLVGIVIPTAFCGIYLDDWRGGFFYASIVRATILLQATWCINSLAHYIGEATYSDQRSPRDSYFVSLITFGEGYHCFHHEFPYYRNGVQYKAYDPTKWLIFGWSLLGLTFNLKRFPSNEIEKGAFLMQMKKLNQKKTTLTWGPRVEDLPIFTMRQVREDTLKGASLIVIKGIVHDVTDFTSKHPGGQAFIKGRLGKDATTAFTGGVYAHSLAAWNVLELLRVGRIEEDQIIQAEDEVVQVEEKKDL